MRGNYYHVRILHTMIKGSQKYFVIMFIALCKMAMVHLDAKNNRRKI